MDRRYDRRADPGLRDEPSAAEAVDDVEVRITPTAERRTSLGGWRIAAIAVIAIVVVGVGLVGPKDGGQPYIDLADLLPRRSTPAPTAVVPRTPPPLPTPLPALEVFAPGGPVDGIPVYYGAPSILDPREGTIRPLAPDLERGTLVGDGAGGTMCVCIAYERRPDSEVAAEIVAVRWDATGTETERQLLIRLEPRTEVSAGWMYALDVALTPDRATAIVAVAIGDPEAITYQVEAFDVASGARSWKHVLARRPAREPVEPLASSDPAATADATPRAPGSADPPGTRVVRRITLRLSPLGDVVAISVEDGIVRSEESVDYRRSHWRIGTEDVAAEPTALILDEPMSTDASCEEGFAFADRYVAVCAAWSPDAGATTTTVRIQMPDGTPVGEVDLGASQWFYGPALVNLDSGMLYLWEQATHRLVRVDAATGQTREVSIGGPQGRGPDFQPSGREIVLAPGRVRWSGLISGLDWSQPNLVGSADGAYVYAAGIEFGPSAPDFRDVRSTGIAVFDADTLEPVRLIAPIATHDTISLTSDGRYVLATGMRGYDEAGLPADWQRSLSIFDAQGGEALVRMGRLDTPQRGDFLLVWPPLQP